jgi:hypothetical protein
MGFLQREKLQLPAMVPWMRGYIPKVICKGGFCQACWVLRGIGRIREGRCLSGNHEVGDDLHAVWWSPLLRDRLWHVLAECIQQADNTSLTSRLWNQLGQWGKEARVNHVLYRGVRGRFLVPHAVREFANVYPIAQATPGPNGFRDASHTQLAYTAQISRPFMLYGRMRKKCDKVRLGSFLHFQHQNVVLVSACINFPQVSLNIL